MRSCQALTVFAGSLALLLAAIEGVSISDIAADAGLREPSFYGSPERRQYIIESTGNGAVIADFDGDGWNDILIAGGALWGSEKTYPPKLYRNDGTGKFKDAASTWGLHSGGWQQGACAGDLDNDGHIDLFVAEYGKNRLYRNTGKRFEVKALPLDRRRWGAGCALLDYDRDGFLDIFVSNYVDFDPASTPAPGSKPECIWKSIPVMCGPVGLPLAKNVLYRNRGNWTFEDVSQTAGILKPGGRYGLGVVSADFNNDGWPDVYVACDQTPSLLYENKGNGTFIERGVEAGVAYNFDGRLQAGMGVAVADFDGNGLFDIAKTNFSGDLPSLYLNEDGRFFRDVSRQAGLGAHQLLGWGAAFVDIDRDGWKDLVMANGHVYPEVDRAKVGDTYRQQTLLYRNLGNGRFADITAKAGPGLAPARPSRGLAAGDLDGDGLPEIVVVNMNEPPAVLKNHGPQRNWVRVALAGTKSNRSAVGARVTIEAGGRSQVDEVRAGGSYFSQHELTLSFGLADAPVIRRIEVRWPSGLKQEWRDVPANQLVRLREADAGSPSPRGK